MEENRRTLNESWLREVTALPTAAGHEDRVIAWVEAWVAHRPELALTRDAAGNMMIRARDAGETPGVMFTAHLDHPAFVVERTEGEGLEAGQFELSFRGGVREAYFDEARIVLGYEGKRFRATVNSVTKPDPFRTVIATLDDPEARVHFAPGDLARWDLPDPEVIDGILHTHACDDLAALVAALSALDALRESSELGTTSVLLTRAEEIGFIGAIAACKHGTIPAGSRVIALENSRSFPESPIGGGPIVRVGDRISTFSPTLTAAVAKVCESIVKRREESGDEPFRWQRKLMPGGACEASCFQAYGHEATCVCLPLGNYHNMANLDVVEKGEPGWEAHAVAGREHIALSDFHGLVDMLIEAGKGLGDVETIEQKMEKLYDERAFVLG